MQIKNYIFDLDGTLFESMNVWEAVDIAFFAKRGLTMPDDYTDAILAMHIADAADYTMRRFCLRESANDIMREWMDMAADLYENVEMKPYAMECLNLIINQGHKLAVATSLPPELMHPALRKHGLHDMFHAICTAQEVGCGKIKPDIFNLAAAKLDTRPEDCLVFDDILAAIKSAKNIGMKVCAVYDKASCKDWDEMKRLADFSAQSLAFDPVSGLWRCIL